MTGADTASEQPPEAVETIALPTLGGPRQVEEWQTLNVPDEEAEDGVHPVTFHKPKVAVIAVMEGAGSSATQMLNSVGTWMPHVFDDATNVYLNTRLEDPEDDFDLEHIVAIGNHLLGVWSTRPTGKSGASRRRSQRTTRRSTGT
jgi:hypothetical protein